jgi:hypothetical protein
MAFERLSRLELVLDRSLCTQAHIRISLFNVLRLPSVLVGVLAAFPSSTIRMVIAGLTALHLHNDTICLLCLFRLAIGSSHFFAFYYCVCQQLSPLFGQPHYGCPNSPLGGYTSRNWEIYDPIVMC